MRQSAPMNDTANSAAAAMRRAQVYLCFFYLISLFVCLFVYILNINENRVKINNS